MTGQTYAVAFVLAAAALAVWIDLRFPRLAPGALGFVLANMGAAALLSDVAGTVLTFTAHAHADLVVPALIACVLPSVVYLMLSAFWLLKLCAGMLPGGGLPGRG